MQPLGLLITGQHDLAELGYWVGKPFWGNEYDTEARKALISFGLENMNLNRIYASRFIRNPASDRVMEMIGMRFEGSFRPHIKRWAVYEYLFQRSILRQEFLQEE